MDRDSGEMCGYLEVLSRGKQGQHRLQWEQAAWWRRGAEVEPEGCLGAMGEPPALLGGRSGWESLVARAGGLGVMVGAGRTMM